MSPSRKSDQPRRSRGSHTNPLVDRIGAIAWLARVALRDEERAA
jgi:hypothetical protein